MLILYLFFVMLVDSLLELLAYLVEVLSLYRGGPFGEFTHPIL